MADQTTAALPSSSLTSFISLNALQPDQLVQLLIQSISDQQEEDDEDDKYAESVSEAIGICEQTLKILHLLERTAKENKNKKLRLVEPIEEHLETGVNKFNHLSCDNLFVVCSYLDSKSKARLRYSSMHMHIDMMGCPISVDVRHLKWIKVHAPMKIMKPPALPSCCCYASRLLLTTVEAKPTLCSNFTDSELSQLGIGRSWSMTTITVKSTDTFDDFWDMCDVLEEHDASRFVTKMFITPSTQNIDIMMDSLPKCYMINLEELTIYNSIVADPDFVLSSELLLPGFSLLRRLKLVNILICLDKLVDYLPHMQELFLHNVKIGGYFTPYDISCLASLKNLNVLHIFTKDTGSDIYGDIAFLSSLRELKELSLSGYRGITGNILSLTTLTKLKILELEITSVEGKIESLLGCLPTLSQLKMGYNLNLEGNLILPESIEELTLYQSDMYLDLSSLVSLKKLRSFHTAAMPNVKGDILLMSALTSLKSFSLTMCNHITGSLNALIASSPSLEEITFTSQVNITGDVDSLSSSSSLPFINLINVPKVTGDINSLRRPSRLATRMRNMI